MSLSFSVKNEDKLFEITKQLAPTLKNQKIIFIEGSVGAGKTTFIRYLLETLAKKDQKKFFFQGSPTYQRENQYYFNELNCVHFDFYQVEDSPHIDLEDYIVDHCLLLEWPFLAVLDILFNWPFLAVLAVLSKWLNFIFLFGGPFWPSFIEELEFLLRARSSRGVW